MVDLIKNYIMGALVILILVLVIMYSILNMKNSSLKVTNENQSKDLKVVPYSIEKASFESKQKTIKDQPKPTKAKHEEVNTTIGKHTITIGMRETHRIHKSTMPYSTIV